MRAHDTWEPRRQTVAGVCGVVGLTLALGASLWWVAAAGVGMLALAAILARREG